MISKIVAVVFVRIWERNIEVAPFGLWKCIDGLSLILFEIKAMVMIRPINSPTINPELLRGEFPKSNCEE